MKNSVAYLIVLLEKKLFFDYYLNQIFFLFLFFFQLIFSKAVQLVF